MGTPGPFEIILILLIVLLLFGAKRIPEIARGLGKGIREFKDATNDIKQELNADPPRQQPPRQIPPQQQQAYHQGPPTTAQASQPVPAEAPEPTDDAERQA